MPHISIPYTPRQVFMESIHSRKKRFCVIVAHRRSGKSVAAANELIKEALSRPNMRLIYIAPTYRQVKDIVWDYIKYYTSVIPNIKVNESELRIDFPNNSRIKLYGAENPDALRGLGLDGCVFDEFAMIKENIFTEIILPALSDKKGFAVFLSTPKGKSHFYYLYQRARQDEDWQAHYYPVGKTNSLPQEELDLAKANMPQDFWLQEYECSFLDNAGAFFKRVRENVDHIPKTGCTNFQLGVDLAKYQDWTVIASYCRDHAHILPLERFNQMDYNLQKAKIEASYLRHGRGRVVIDQTGVGESVVDDLRTRGINMLPFKFSGASRPNLLRNLQILLEQDKVKIPDDDGLITELESMQYTLGPTGNVKLEVPSGMTDDRIMATALSVWQLPKETALPIDRYELEANKYIYGVQDHPPGIVSEEQYKLAVKTFLKTK